MGSFACRVCLLSLLALVPSLVQADESRPEATERILMLVTADGLRWQEVFQGADETLLNKEDGGVADVGGVRRQFWRDAPQGRREASMPFLWWSVLAKQGQLYGDADQGSQTKLEPWPPPLGERKDLTDVPQSPIAATAAALPGEDHRSEFPGAAAPIAVRP